MAVAVATLWGPTETIASFTDDLWVQETDGFTAASFFGIEGSDDGGSNWRSTETIDDALEFAPELALFPGESDYMSIDLRTSDNSPAATVTMSEAMQQAALPSDSNLWTTHVTYSARAIGANVDCDASVFSGDIGVELATPGTLGDNSPTGEISLDADQGSTSRVCLSFTLNSSVHLANPPVPNGASVHPYWRFVGEQETEAGQ